MAEAAAGQDTGHTMTKADLVEEVTRVTELPRKESEAVVETIFESIISALQTDYKIEIRGLEAFAPANAEGAPAVTRRPEPRSKCLPRRSLSSSPARN
jgi:nucleoid DNA-binding protein